MRNSLSAGKAGNIFRTGADFVQVGTNVPYASVHQFGYKPKNIPQRAFLGFNDDTVKKITRIIGSHFRKGGE